MAVAVVMAVVVAVGFIGSVLLSAQVERFCGLSYRGIILCV